MLKKQVKYLNWIQNLLNQRLKFRKLERKDVRLKPHITFLSKTNKIQFNLQRTIVENEETIYIVRMIPNY